MTYPKTESYRDDFEPNVHPLFAQVLHGMRTSYAVGLANKNLAAPARWPFPLTPIPPDRKTPPPAHSDAEDAPW